jgi:hypothetical protein
MFYVGAIALSLASLVLPAYTAPEPEATAPKEEVAGGTDVTTEDNVEIDELTDNLEAYVGQTVTIRADALETVGESSILQNDDWFGGKKYWFSTPRVQLSSCCPEKKLKYRQQVKPESL